MVPEIHWPAIALRLALTVVAGTILGTERSILSGIWHALAPNEAKDPRFPFG